MKNLMAVQEKKYGICFLCKAELSIFSTLILGLDKSSPLSASVAYER